MINRPVDLVGILQLLWNDDWRRAALEKEDYRQQSLQLHTGASISPKNIDHYLAYLHSAKYRKFASGSTEKETSAITARAVLPVILNIVQLRQTFANEIEMTGGRTVRVESEIPPYTIYTVDLAMNLSEQKTYYKVYESQTKGIKRGVDEKSEDGRINFQKHRRLQHTILDPRLNTLVKISTVKEVNKWYEDLVDHGATKIFHKLLSRDLGVKPYGDQTSMTF